MSRRRPRTPAPTIYGLGMKKPYAFVRVEPSGCHVVFVARWCAAARPATAETSSPQPPLPLLRYAR